MDSGDEEEENPEEPEVRGAIRSRLFLVCLPRPQFARTSTEVWWWLLNLHPFL